MTLAAASMAGIARIEHTYDGSVDADITTAADVDTGITIPAGSLFLGYALKKITASAATTATLIAKAGASITLGTSTADLEVVGSQFVAPATAGGVFVDTDQNLVLRAGTANITDGKFTVSALFVPAFNEA